MSSFNVEKRSTVAAVPRSEHLPDRLPWAAAVVVIFVLAAGLWTGTVMLVDLLFH
jgi:hypothetical protein